MLAAMGTEEAADELRADWHADPFGRHAQRWWDGSRWTEKVRDGVDQAIDPPGIEEAPHYPGEIPAAEPIENAPLPLRPPSAGTQIALIVGTFVLVGLIAVIVLLAVAG
jgi:hypothetical protein